MTDASIAARKLALGTFVENNEMFTAETIRSAFKAYLVTNYNITA